MSTPRSEIYTIFCVVVGNKDPFSIEIPKTKTVDTLKKMIKLEKPKAFENIDPDELNLYRVELGDDNDLVENVKAEMERSPSPLRATRRLDRIFKTAPEDDTVHIIVVPPQSLQRSAASEPPITAEFKAYVDAVKFFTRDLSHYRLEDLKDGLNNTHLRVSPAQNGRSPFQSGTPTLDRHPDFVSEYLQQLDAKRLASKAQLDELKKFEQVFDQAMLGAHFELSETDELSFDEFNTYTARLKPHARGLDRIQQRSSFFKDSHLTVNLVDPALTDDSDRDPWHYDKDVGWNPLLLQGTLADHESLYTFKPRSDFCLVHIICGPLIMCEIISEESESGRWRMLFEGAAVCRYQNMVRTDGKAAVLCLYLNKKYEMERYLVYQLAGNQTRDVYVLHDLTLDLTKVQDAFLLSKQLFNFRHRLAEIPGVDSDRRDKLLLLQGEVKNCYRVSLTAARQARSRGGHSSRTMNRSLHPISEDAALRASFNAINILNHRQKDVATAIRRSDMQTVVLKRIKTNSSELRILRLLQSCALQGSSHVIPLLEVVEQPPGISTLVMPYYTPILDLKKGRAEELALQLIRGVDWLHKQLISHSDIKARNLVFDERHHCLLIIDFGLAVKLTSREQKVRGARGTAEHVAPEVGITVSWENYLEEVFVDEDSIYSPILADVWAVGDVMDYFQRWFGSSTEGIRTVVEKVAKELRAVDPTKRLSLHDAEGRIAAACNMAATAQNPPTASPWIQGSPAVSTIVALRA